MTNMPNFEKDNWFGRKGFGFICEMMKTNKTITRLKLDDDGMTKSKTQQRKPKDDFAFKTAQTRMLGKSKRCAWKTKKESKRSKKLGAYALSLPMENFNFFHKKNFSAH